MNIVLPDDQKIFSMDELESLGYSRYRVRSLVAEGKLCRLCKSFFANPSYSGEESDFFYVEAYAPRGVVCLLSAAAHYGLTTYIPDSVDVAIPRKARVSTSPDWPRFSIHYFPDARYGLGIVADGNGKDSFLIYDIEKTVVDIVSYREKIGIEETKEVLMNYLGRKDRDLNRLLDYSRAMKCGALMRTYLEVLV